MAWITRRNRTRIAKSYAAFFIAILMTPHSWAASELESFTPQGMVKSIRQVQARFSAPVIRFGEPRAEESPFRIQCAPEHTTKWIDDRTWSLDFKNDLPPGISCEFHLKDDFKDVAGDTVDGLQGRRRFKFSTGGPSILSTHPSPSTNILNDQAFILTLDGEVDLYSVISHAFFAVEGLRERVDIRLISGQRRNEILNAFFRYRQENTPRDHIIIIQGLRHFPDGAKVTLHWSQGVLSKDGHSVVEPQTFEFKVRPAFEARFTCTRDNATADCNPILPMEVEFTAEISLQEARKIQLISSDKKTWRPAESDQKKSTQASDATVRSVSFQGPFPELADFTVVLPDGFKDIDGRALANQLQYPLRVRTNAYSPLAKFSAPFGVLELKADPALPLSVRNIEDPVLLQQMSVGGTSFSFSSIEQAAAILDWLHKVDLHHSNRILQEKSLFADGTRPPGAKEKSFQLPKPHGSRAFELLGIPLPEPGLHIIEVASPRLGEAFAGPGKTLHTATAALVTDLSVHFKHGRESSLVWVTRLSNGEPVKGARVSIHSCEGALHAKATTDADGLARISELPLPAPACPNSFSEGYVVFAQKDGDLSLVSSKWDDGIEGWRFQVETSTHGTPESWGPTLAHTVLDRMLYRAGDTVHMKHFLREHTTTGFRGVKANNRPKKLVIQHEGSGKQFEFPLTWDLTTETSTTRWKIPQEVPLGTYSVSLSKKPLLSSKSSVDLKSSDDSDDAHGEHDLETLRTGVFRVEEFRVPLMSAVVKLPDGKLIRPKAVTADVSAQYLSGGGAHLLPIRLRSQVKPNSYVPFETHPEFLFANGPVLEKKVGGERRDLKENQAELPLITKDLKLDKTGALRTQIGPLPEISQPMRLVTEMEFMDPNGEIQTVSSQAELWPSRYMVGLRRTNWMAVMGEQLEISAVVLDISGKPVTQAPVTVDVFETLHYSHRKKLVGGFYAYESSSETKRLGVFCQGVTDSKGRFTCSAPPPKAGYLDFQASTRDAESNRSHARISVHVYDDKTSRWYTQGENDRIDLLPEKPRYEPGDRARFEVQMPFEEATALITVEREGVMDTFVRRLSRAKSVFELPIKKNYAPNVFVSALVIRGRVAEPKPTGLIDLAKPAFKLGLSQIKVGWQAHELRVHLETDREVYRVREKAKLKVQVTRADGSPLTQPSEIAVAAVDEGLLEIQPNSSWKLLDAMMGRRVLEVKTSALQGQVIGKRHFGLKSRPPGGDGGARTSRELFDTLLHWVPRIQLDSTGSAEVEIPINDSLTRFAIVAIAQSGLDSFGTGQTTIRSTKDLMLFSGAPPLVREGDRIESVFTVRNATDRAMNVQLKFEIKGLKEQLPPRDLNLAAGASKPVVVPFQVPSGLDKLKYHVHAVASDGTEDRLSVQSKVVPPVPERVLQATISQIEKELTLPVEKPQGALPNRGGLRVIAQAQLGRGLDGVRRYMGEYAYTCFEQKLSQAISLENSKLIREIFALMPSYLDANGFLRYFPGSSPGSDILTSYALSITDESGYSIPEDTRQKMEAALTRFVRGEIDPNSQGLSSDLLPYRKLTALEALSRRGPLDASMIQSLSITPQHWPTNSVIDWIQILRRSPQLPEQVEHLKAAEQVLRTRLTFQGSTTGFSTEDRDRLPSLMTSVDTNAVRLLLTAVDLPQWKGDVSRLVRGALGRQKNGHWDLTTANAWGTLALKKFSSAFEKDSVQGEFATRLASKTHRFQWAENPSGRIVNLKWEKPLQVDLTLTHSGTGRPWVTVQSIAAVPLKEPFFSGYRIRRRIEPLEQKVKGRWSVGDVMRVRLEIDAQSDQPWVVISDPIPSGATILGSGLGRDSSLMSRRSGHELSGATFQERGFEAFRSYHGFVEKGKLATEYTLRLNSAGNFHLPPTRVEAMYAPEAYGEIPNGNLHVAP